MVVRLFPRKQLVVVQGIQGLQELQVFQEFHFYQGFQEVRASQADNTLHIERRQHHV